MNSISLRAFQFVLFLVLLLALWPDSRLMPAAATAKDFTFTAASNRDSISSSILHARQCPNNSFSCWLSNLTITVPYLNLSADGLTLQVENLTCNGIALRGVSSRFVPPNAL